MNINLRQKRIPGNNNEISGKGPAISHRNLVLLCTVSLILHGCANSEEPSQPLVKSVPTITKDTGKTVVAAARKRKDKDAKSTDAKSKEKTPTIENSAKPTKPASPSDLSSEEKLKMAHSKCDKDMETLEGRDSDEIKKVCKKVQVFDSCFSVKGKPIYHYDSLTENQKGKRILVFALIHGDEGPSGSVARLWMERLNKIAPRNNWRVVPVLNPDGWVANTRMNANKIDINRNFPTKNWKRDTSKRWKSKKYDPRRFPGKVAASEPETKCAIEHIDDFAPGFIISIHTPYGVLDFDGPRMQFPNFKPLRWFSLGNYPGSMGRYMWAERRVPVLTIELKGNENIASKLEQFDHLQDISGTVAIQSERILKSKEKKRLRAAKRKEKLTKKKKPSARRTSKRGNKRKIAKKRSDSPKL